MIAVFVGVAIVIVPSPAHAGDATTEDVYSALGLYEAEAHYVVLVDTSGSMETNNLYRYVQDGLTRFMGAIGQDTVTVMSFAEDVSAPCFSGTVDQPTEVLKCLPRKATGQGTDIGKAIDAALTDVKENQAPVSIVLLISDGDQQAPATSPYGTPSLKSGAWAALRKRADVLPNVFAYALQLGKSTSARTLGVVFKHTQTLNAKSQAEVRTGLAPPKAEVLKQAVRSTLAPDMSKPLKISWSTDSASHLNAADGAADIMLTIQPDTENVPLTLDDVSLKQVDGTPVTVDPLPSTIELTPGVPYLALAHVTWPVPAWPRMHDRQVDVLAHLQLKFSLHSSWDKVLAEHGLKRTTPVRGEQNVTIAGSSVAGMSISFYIGVPLLVVGLIVAVIALIRRRRRDSPAEFMAVTYQRAVP
jgi:hypothetical protein